MNIGHVDLGRIDLLVRDGFFSNRTDLIRTAIRNQLDRHEDVLRKSASRGGLEFGLRHVTRAELEQAKAGGSPIAINVIGLASISDDVTPELARQAIASVQVLGSLQASAAVKAALRDRTI